MKLTRLDWCVYGMTDAQDGDAKKNKNLKNKIEEKFGLQINRWITGEQVHGTQLQIVANAATEHFPQTDGFVSEVPNLFLAVFIADCVPVIFWEAKRKVVGILHAGWRGTVKGIVKEALVLLKENWQIKPQELNFFLGAHIRSCCYEVGKEVAGQFPEECLLQKNGKEFLDLENALKHQLRILGGKAEQISAYPACTFCDSNFFSFRRDKTEKRMLAFIGKPLTHALSPEGVSAPTKKEGQATNARERVSGQAPKERIEVRG